MSLDDTQSFDLINLVQAGVDHVLSITPCPGDVIHLKLDKQAASEHEAERFLVEKFIQKQKLHTVKQKRQSSKTNEGST